MHTPSITKKQMLAVLDTLQQLDAKQTTLEQLVDILVSDSSYSLILNIGQEEVLSLLKQLLSPRLYEELVYWLYEVPHHPNQDNAPWGVTIDNKTYDFSKFTNEDWCNYLLDLGLIYS